MLCVHDGSAWLRETGAACVLDCSRDTNASPRRVQPAAAVAHFWLLFSASGPKIAPKYESKAFSRENCHVRASGPEDRQLLRAMEEFAAPVGGDSALPLQQGAPQGAAPLPEAEGGGTATVDANFASGEAPTAPSAAVPAVTTGSASACPQAKADEGSSSDTQEENPRPLPAEVAHESSSSREPRLAPSAEAKQRARLKRQFVRNQWLDINKAPSWPPIKKNRYLDTDWQSVDFKPQAPETKKSRLFLNSLCYLFEGVITKKSTLGRRAGLGLFCERAKGFAKGTVITEFVGWLVDREQAEQLRKRRRASHIVAVQKGFLYIDGVKDPYYGTGGASFANDGSEFLGGPGNNSYFYHWYDEELGRTRVFLRATRDIAQGEEIFVPYDKNYWLDNFEEQEDNCPDAFRKRKIEQLQRKYKDYTITSMEDLKARQALLEKLKRDKLEKQKEKKAPRKPNVKRPLSGYMRFSVSRRRELIAAEPELRHPKCFKEIAQRISQEWKALCPKKRKAFQDEAAADFTKYRQKVLEWRAKHAPKRRRKARRNANTRVRSAAASSSADAGSEEAEINQSGTEKTPQHAEVGQTETESPDTANAATDVPESSDEVSNNSRQSSSTPESNPATKSDKNAAVSSGDLAEASCIAVLA
ncbi:uncharacterized protein LOC34618724 [Cyclospora cayetanensis]|uniref:Uncharacterized protein LOC34618724 n=1 Tax=Cyclospora cayetanensis TaxID=88456 RepID=A0A6P6S1W6_9EIME|nr:uncharacterized protein LOC34618724 [Cyclospora cayetanensis]